MNGAIKRITGGATEINEIGKIVGDACRKINRLEKTFLFLLYVGVVLYVDI